MSIIIAVWLVLIVAAIAGLVGAWFYIARRQPTSPIFARRRRNQVINFPDRRKMRRAP